MARKPPLSDPWEQREVDKRERDRRKAKHASRKRGRRYGRGGRSSNGATDEIDDLFGSRVGRKPKIFGLVDDGFGSDAEFDDVDDIDDLDGLDGLDG